jgi:hypothetical protein
MQPIEDGFDPIIFPKRMSWRRRVSAWISREQPKSQNPFLNGNTEAITDILNSSEIGLRMVVNIPADALLSFLREQRYKNAYERPVVAGGSGDKRQPRDASDTRRKVEEILGFGEDAHRYYYGAVALGGTGVRFYGDYCMVLNSDVIAKTTAVFERNSYDLVRPPLSDVSNTSGLVRCLRGQWAKDLIHMLLLKVLPKLKTTYKLVTTGFVSDAILHDEDFVEVHRKKTFSPGNLEEIRISPEDEACHNRVRKRFRSGIPPTSTEFLWCIRRSIIEQELNDNEINSRLVVSSGRGNRWR